MEKRYSTIDIGTNTILMLIAEHDEESGMKIIRDEHSLARLGQGIGLDSRNIHPQALERSIKILSNYKKICEELEVSEIFAVATSAMRDAENSNEVKEVFSSILDTDINIISGESEAKFSFMGAVEDEQDSLVIDIGGGSTEIISGTVNELFSRNSLQIGAVRLTEACFHKHPPNIDDLQNANENIKNVLKNISVSLQYKKVYAVAGTPTTLAGIMLNLKEFERNHIEGYKLHLKDIKNLYNTMINMSIEDIINKYSVNPARADVITAGTLILINILEYIKSDFCIASTKGLRYGMMKYLLSE